MASFIFRQIAQRVFDCGKCLHCRKKKARELAIRCVLNASLYTQNSFLTLTYDESKEGYHNNFQYEDIQKFKKRFRSYVSRVFGKRIELFNVHEYGKNGKKHWHLVCFGHDFSDDVLKKRRVTREIYTFRNGNFLYTSPKLEDLWRFGFSTIGDVTEASAMYQAQYTQKDWKNCNVGTSRQSDSQHSGIGRSYFLSHYSQILRLGFIPVGGKRVPVPRYFEKLAHKHYCHFYDCSYFFDTSERKRRYTPFEEGQENRDIADLYMVYRVNKDNRILEMEDEWNDIVDLHLETGEDPDFVKSGDNSLYDLRNKNNIEIF